MGLENIYLQKQSASSFARAVSYDTRSLAALARLLTDRYSTNKSALIHILDIGTGPGSFIIPVVEFFEKEGGPDYRLDCVDASEHMAHLFDLVLAQSCVPQEKVKYMIHDANRGLAELYRRRGYDLIFATFVLHYVRNWERLLKEMAECLKDGGMLMLAEVAGDFRNLDGHFDVKSPMLFRQFCRQYFTERATYSAWTPIISVSDLSVAFAYLRNRKRLEIFREEFLLWNTSVTWDELCNWVADAPLSSLGAGLTIEDRNRLALTMRRWLVSHNIGRFANIPLRWGVKVTCLTREKSWTSSGRSS